jgi:glyceraldehyde-3-phosphate dehydrogenase (NAD(P))
VENKNIVHVVGTGTIGEPLIGILADLKKDLCIDEVTFSKHTPLLIDRSKVKSLMKRGAKLSVEKEKLDDFRKLELNPDYEYEEAISRASIVIDCTPVGLENKKLYYGKFEDQVRRFVAQGSEFGFGKMYAFGINDQVLTPNDKYVQVVSCNTHNMAVIIKTLAMNGNTNLAEGRFVCLRRASDISQNGGFIPSIMVDKHEDQPFGTHHARDVYWLYKTIGYDLNIFSSAVKINTQYMHAIWFDLHLTNKIDIDEVMKRLEKDSKISITHKTLSNLVFSFGRDHGYYGRILNQTVVVMPTVTVRNGGEVLGFCFTPQDGNSLLSSIAMIEHTLCPDNWEENMTRLNPYLFKEV